MSPAGTMSEFAERPSDRSAKITQRNVGRSIQRRELCPMPYTGHHNVPCSDTCSAKFGGHTTCRFRAAEEAAVRIGDRSVRGGGQEDATADWCGAVPGKL